MRNGFHMISFQVDPSQVILTARQIRVLVGEKGKELFARLGMTPEAEVYLEENPDLKEVIDTW